MPPPALRSPVPGRDPRCRLSDKNFSDGIFFASRLAGMRPAVPRSTSVRFGIRAIWEKAQRRFMHPRGNTIGCRPDFLITNDGAVERRLLGTATEVDPGSDAA